MGGFFAISVFLMCLGYNGPCNVRRLFSHPFWYPMARLSYGVYLYTPVIAFVTSFAHQISMAYTNNGILAMFFVYAVVAYFISFLQYLLIEKPLVNSVDF